MPSGGRVFWAVTGAGSRLRSLASMMLDLKLKYDVRFTVGFSRWGYEVARIYGVLSLLKRVAGGGYMEEFLVGDEGMYYVGRLNTGRYDLLLVAPATSNTVAKMVNGIADTLPTAAFAEAGKSGVPVIVYPSDIPGSDGYAVSEAPCMVNRDKCDCMEKLGYCPASEACPVDAIPIVSGKPRIDLSLCIGCGKCVDACVNKAITCWAPVRVKPRRIDLENIEKLKDFSNVIIASSTSEVREAILNILSGNKSRDRRAKSA